MKFKYYIVYKRELLDIISWPADWSYKCAANLASMIREVLNTEGIGTEIKCVVDDSHRNAITKEHGVTDQDIDHYLAANCSTLLFSSIAKRNKSITALKKMGAIDEQFKAIDLYRDVILTQAEIYRKQGGN